MNNLGRARPSRLGTLAATLAIAGVSACSQGGTEEETGVWAPGVDHTAEAEDGLVVGHRLMAAGEYELALDAFTRAALDKGLTSEVLSSLGSANLGLGRLGQAEELLRKAVEADPGWPEASNNLGVVLMERQKYPEAAQVLRRAYALDNGESDAIRDNLRVALEKLENPDNNSTHNNDYKLVQRGGGSYLIRKTP